MSVTKIERMQQTTLNLLTRLRVISTTQIATFLSDHGSPDKRASEILQSLKDYNLIEGKRVRIDRPKIWRMTSKGRLKYGVTYRPVPFNDPKLDHFLALGDTYLTLSRTGKLRDYRIELREPFLSMDGKDKVFCPDAYFIYNNRAYVLELQKSYLTAKKWAEKWKIYEEYFLHDHFKKASWQIEGHNPIRPNIIVLSTQQPETVREFTSLNVRVLKSIKELEG